MVKSKSMLDDVIRQTKTKPLSDEDAGFRNEAKDVLSLAEKTTEDK
jgi:hypothetical protein